MALYEFERKAPAIGKGAYVAETADVIGNVTIGRRCFIGPGARIKGDYGTIIIGDSTSVQENSIIHARPGGKCVVGNRVTIGHGAILHNCTIEDNAVVGMGAIVSDWAVVGKSSLIGEGSVVTQNQRIPARSIALGVPAKVAGKAGKEVASFRQRATKVYTKLAGRYRKSLRRLS